MKKLQFIPLALLLAVSCGAISLKSKSTTAVAPRLESTSWQVDELAGRHIDAQDENYTLIFNTEERLNGRGDCNVMFGQYAQGAEFTLSLSPMGLTRSACPNMDAEREYISALEQVTHFEIVDGRLYLYGGELLLITLDSLEIAEVE